MYNSYSLLVQTVDCEEEFLYGSLLGMNRRMVIYDYLKERLHPDTLPIFIDDWERSWSKNIPPCTGAGAMIKLVLWTSKSSYHLTNSIDSGFTPFFINFEENAMDFSKVEGRMIQQYNDSIHTNNWAADYTFIVFSVECVQE